MNPLHLFLLFLAFVAAWIVYSRRQPRRGEFPPGPPRLPILGNILQLGSNPHKSLAQLAKTYGPLMSLRFGAQFVVVASSPELAREVLLTQDRIFSKPFNPEAICVHDHGLVSMNMLGANTDGWKRLRRITRENLFSKEALAASQSLRQERLRELSEHVSRCSGEGRAMNVGEAVFTTMSNIIFTTLFSAEFIQYDAPYNKLMEHVNAITQGMGIPNVSDFFPIVAPFDPQGLRRKMSYHMGCLVEIVQSIIEQRLKQRNPSSSTHYQKKNDVLETLLDLMEAGYEYNLSMEEIKHLFVDLIIAATDTGSATTEWAMVELLLHPEKMAKVKAELKSVIGDEKRIIEESDISKFPYLQATIKEVLRFHPVAPLLAPHASVEETRVNGYRIPKNTKMFVNFWAISQDPVIWKDPENFEPERFLGNDIDFQGHHFELVPFGSGRRMCPGIPLASRTMPCLVATLCHNFDWKLEQTSKQIQREEEFGLALHKKTPLRAIPIIL